VRNRDSVRVCKIVDFLFSSLRQLNVFPFSIFTSANSLCLMDYNKSKKDIVFEKRERTKFVKAYRMRIDFKFDKFYVWS
jgi:hypothetical protein